MKRLIPHICIVALAAAFGLTTSCSKSGSGTITAKYRFTGTPSGTAKGGTTRAAAVQGTEDFTEFYSNLGAKKGAFTPTEMVIAVGNLTIAQELGFKGHDLIRSFGNSIAEGIVMVDLAKPITVSAEGIEPGFYDYLHFTYSDSYAERHDSDNPNDWEWLSFVSFPKPSGIDLQTHAYSSLEEGSARVSKAPDQITVLLNLLQPVAVDYHWGSFTKNANPGKRLGTKVGGVHQLFFLGDKYIVVPCSADEKRLSDIIPGTMQLGISNSTVTGIIIPFKGIEVPEDATAVRFEIVWDIEDIVEWYEGPSNQTTDDDIFVLRDGFWNGFSVKAVIEQ